MQEASTDVVEPRAAAMVESLRAFGYDLATALADLADNSLFHRSRNLTIHFHWAGPDSAIVLADDGTGMDEPTLKDAMRLGSRNPREPRDPGDFGRFGLGLKTASFSQCRRVTVFTKREGETTLVRCWDLDHIANTDAWQLLCTPSNPAAKLAQILANAKSGTVVVWEKLDRITGGTSTESDADEDAFLSRAEQVGEHFSVVFHQLMTGVNAAEFSLNGKPLKPWDPFLIGEPATQRFPVERLQFHGQTVEVEPFVLPHLSKLPEDLHRRAAGLRGWNAHQGFYVYRNCRLLVPGDWLGIKGWRQEEHYKLARIRINLPNTLDHEWEIDVTKSRARPPEKLRRELTRIGERARSMAKRIYTHRGAKLIPAAGQEQIFLWEQTARHNQVYYRINRNHPLVKQVRSKCADVPTFSALLRLIEETIPVPLITITDREKPDQTLGPFETANASDVLGVMEQVFNALRTTGYSVTESLIRLGTMEPFPRFPAELQSFAERMGASI